jgi:hypothetical protein
VVTQPLQGESATSQQTQLVQTTDVFLFAGVGNPNDFTTSTNLQQQLDKLNDISNLASSAVSFELITPKPGQQQANILNNQQPDGILLGETLTNVQDATNMFLVGNVPPQPDSATSLAKQVTSTIQNNPDVVGTTPSANQQSQTFVSKLLNGEQSTQ